MVKRLALVFMALLLHIATIKASAIDDIIEFCQLPKSVYDSTLKSGLI